MNLRRIINIMIMLIFVFVQGSFAQESVDDFELLDEICQTLKGTQELSDSLRVQYAFHKHLYPYLSQLDVDQQEVAADRIVLRLQKNCKEFKELVIRMYPSYGDWQIIDEIPLSSLNKKACRRILKYEKLWYIEAENGSKTYVDVDGKYWIDRFKDGTYSKLKFKWISACDFEISYIESTNAGRKELSNTGDVYRYRLIDLEGNAFKTSVEIPGMDNNSLFKIYFEE